MSQYASRQACERANAFDGERERGESERPGRSGTRTLFNILPQHDNGGTDVLSFYSLTPSSSLTSRLFLIPRLRFPWTVVGHPEHAELIRTSLQSLASLQEATQTVRIVDEVIHVLPRDMNELHENSLLLGAKHLVRASSLENLVGGSSPTVIL